jgi:two-component system, OmpR family, KDP operon response regulator KdpE
MDYSITTTNLNHYKTSDRNSVIGTVSMIGKKVLIIDDDTDLLKLTSFIFKGAGAQVVTARDGSEGIGKLLAHHPNLILLDVMMPGIDGFELCQKIRQISNTPLIMLTALDHEQSLLHGLDVGADDFLSKPFKPEILLARAKTLLRRSGNGNGNISHPAAFKYKDGRLEIDAERHQILINGKQIKTTPIEFRLLVYLERNAGRTLTYSQILDNVWGEEYRGSVDFVHVYISHLRSKIEENPKSPRYIHSVHGVGYIFERQHATLDD